MVSKLDNFIKLINKSLKNVDDFFLLYKTYEDSNYSLRKEHFQNIFSKLKKYIKENKQNIIDDIKANPLFNDVEKYFLIEKISFVSKYNDDFDSLLVSNEETMIEKCMLEIIELYRQIINLSNSIQTKIVLYFKDTNSNVVIDLNDKEKVKLMFKNFSTELKQVQHKNKEKYEQLSIKINDLKYLISLLQQEKRDYEIEEIKKDIVDALLKFTPFFTTFLLPWKSNKNTKKIISYNVSKEV